MADHALHHRLTRRAQYVAWVTLACGIGLTALKFLVFALTNSAAVLADALESIVNLLAACLAIYSTRFAAQPPDREHPYGHGRVEFIAVGIEGTMIFLAGAAVLYESISRLITGVELQDLGLGIILQALVTLLVIALGLFVAAMGRRLQSPTLSADGKHLLTDAGTTGITLLSLVLIYITGWMWIDPAAGMILAGLIFYIGVGLVRESLGGLMDRIDLADDRTIRAILDQEVRDGAILSYHKVRHRHIGAFHWVDLHLQVPGTMNVRRAHALASRIEHRIEQRLGRAYATAHIEPPLEEPS